jgi:hypothetical protein
VRRARSEIIWARLPHPPVFDKRGCKLLKTKGGTRKKRGKRLQEYRRKGVSLFVRDLGRIICRANMMEVIMLVYALSRDFGGKLAHTLDRATF